LAVAEELTGSRFGFIGELNEAGLFNTLAISNPGWAACEMSQEEARRAIVNMPLRGVDRGTLREGKSRIVNEPASHPDHVSVPEGHPPIACFLGVTLERMGRTIGLIGLANREGGYDRSHQEDIEALAVAFVEALYRKRIEDESHKAREELEIRVRERTAELVEANQMLLAEIAKREQADETLRKREAELLAARRIQQHLLPDGPPTLPGFDIAGMTYPAAFAAGDYFDYLPMRDGLMGFVVADVSGHGIGPAIVTASTQAYLRSLAELHTEVDEILKLANAILCRETKDNLFVTLLLAKLDPGTRSFVYASAGHPTGYILGSSGEVKAHLESTGPPLGIMPDAIFPVGCPMALEPGDLVLLLTDGLPEARSPEDSSFGIERAIDVVRNNRDQTAGEIVASVYRALQGFSRRDAPLDDVTVVVIKVQPAR
jgi:serine phosphatase RsbU (regulator of sigma subunit)